MTHYQACTSILGMTTLHTPQNHLPETAVNAHHYSVWQARRHWGWLFGFSCEQRATFGRFYLDLQGSCIPGRCRTSIKTTPKRKKCYFCTQNPFKFRKLRFFNYMRSQRMHSSQSQKFLKYPFWGARPMGLQQASLPSPPKLLLAGLQTTRCTPARGPLHLLFPYLADTFCFSHRPTRPRSLTALLKWHLSGSTVPVPLPSHTPALPTARAPHVHPASCSASGDSSAAHFPGHP